MTRVIPLTASENIQLRNFLLFAALALGWLALDLTLPLLNQGIDFRLFTTYMLPGLGGLMLFFLDRLSRQGESDVPIVLASAGIIVIAGGAGFDLATTLFINPDLTREANPFIRAMLDSDHALGYVYWHFGVTQIVFIACFCMSWITFLRHRPILLETIVAAKPNSCMDFLKAATGGAHLTMRQWIFPIRRTEFPTTYHSIWVAACAVIFGISLFRWYVALEWLDIVPPDTVLRALVVAGSVVGSMVVYFVSLCRLYKSEVAQAAHGPS